MEQKKGGPCLDVEGRADSATLPFAEKLLTAPVRVLYDISVLGVGYRLPAARTGIFRVVERVANGLAAFSECELTLCAPQSLHTWTDAHDYLSAHPVLGNVPMVHPGRSRQWERALTGKIDRINEHPHLGVPTKAVRKALWLSRRVVERYYRASVLRQVPAVDVFHSPIYPLPLRSQVCAQVRFLTIYDLIPARFPHFCDVGVPQSMGAVYRSLGPGDWALAISESTKADLCEYQGTDPSRVFVTPLAADPLTFFPCTEPERLREVRERYGIGDGPYLLSLNTLEPRKNLDHAVRAFAAVTRQERASDLRLVLVGAKGWRYERIFEALRAAGMEEGRIIVTGFVADEDLAPLYSGAVAFVYPSFYEGFGLPPLEAMQCGVPVITSNTSSLPEVVGEAGILLDPTDEDGLAHCMLQLYRDSALREEMRTRSLQRARQFTWERCVAATFDAYRTALQA